MPLKWLSREKCTILLSKEIYGRLATCDDQGQPYITPVNFIVLNDRIYFHTGFTGKKLDNLLRNPRVCFEVSKSGNIYPTPHARNFTMRFWSILVFGRARIVEDLNLKFEVMNRIMDKYASEYDYKALSPEDMSIVNVVEITMDEIVGKASVNP